MLSKAHTWRAPLLSLATILAVIYLAYNTALPGFFLFDDAPNLQGLKLITDWSSFFGYLISGESGPLGRPLALASFALQRDSWPNNPGQFIHINIAVHLASVIAVFCLSLGLLKVRSSDYAFNNLWVATAISGLWGLSPFLAPTHLMVIQRMTSLSGLFVFLGLAGFVWSFVIEPRSRLLAGGLLLNSAILGTLFAVFTKENGALLPLLAILIAALWMPDTIRYSSRLQKLIFVCVIVIPALILLGYLSDFFFRVLEHGYGLHRDFTLKERLLTQLWVVLDYLRNLIIPQAANISPFSDGIVKSTGWLQPPATLLSLAVWISILTVGIIFRRSAPFLLFGISFFLMAHIIESTFIGLELYFPHRNYVPAFGIYFALTVAIANLPVTDRRLKILSLAGYGFLFVIVLFQVTTLWRDQRLAAEFWFERNPTSSRASQFAANQYLRVDDRATASRILKLGASANPQDAMLRVQSVIICENGRELEKTLPELMRWLRSAPLSKPLIFELVKIGQGKPSAFCSALTHQDIVQIVNALLSNDNYQSNYAKENLLIAKGFATAEMGDLAGAATFFVNSFFIQPSLDTAFTGAALMANAGNYDQAQEFLRSAHDLTPQGILKGKLWKERLLIFEEIIEDSRLLEMEGR